MQQKNFQEVKTKFHSLGHRTQQVEAQTEISTQGVGGFLKVISTISKSLQWLLQLIVPPVDGRGVIDCLMLRSTDCDERFLLVECSSQPTWS